MVIIPKYPVVAAVPHNRRVYTTTALYGANTKRLFQTITEIDAVGT